MAEDEQTLPEGIGIKLKNPDAASAHPGVREALAHIRERDIQTGLPPDEVSKHQEELVESTRTLPGLARVLRTGERDRARHERTAAGDKPPRRLR